ncbi:beta-1,6-N-acetylglucosaminyltransferase [Leisingera sp. M527]|uniref:beta-1,6-N-acetylglucosaminyltransferase n=1 Tax=unclassified Leisingera TaxID=2614906 RepID=UPI0021A501EF|nr:MULTISPECIES: beta-1,6-N-acetylglucosaminyltransferase [unclassified Leisingera]UWQ28822.1 beta-1,6-N-acetylglucosaminyltransferase [Leisingera sp. M523]UWQ32734.1 beta-1,6-N-acetylglucosaminyltransferase [Leisingera sp. M527]
MSAVGVVMLVHTALDRAAQVVRHWTASGCPVVLHVDRNVGHQAFTRFKDVLADDPLVRFSARHRCEWGTWGIVAASQSASEVMLAEFPLVRHVYLASGSCLPLRPVQELIDYLAARPRTDFIESATTADVPWIVGGLSHERFTLRFPFSWKKHRYLFDRYVDLQRKLRIRRRVPPGLVPHMGSQWWCLTRQTLSAILEDPERPVYDTYFRKVWIPDESYFQTLVRQYSSNIESRSLTLSKFDFQGKPHIFYDDHLQLLRRSDCFVARKIWPHAERLYQAFLTDSAGAMKRTEPNPGKIDRIFAKAVERRTRGRPGLYMQSRFPGQGSENGITSSPYSVFQGFTELFDDFETWLARTTGARVHGHIFAPDGAAFSEGQRLVNGCLNGHARIRDYNPESFLTSLIWNTRGERQCFQFGPGDNQAVNWLLARDANVQISVISGAWAVPLFKSNRNFTELRQEAAKLQQTEAEQLQILRSQWTKARVRIWSMAEFVEAPMEPLQTIIDEIGPLAARHLSEAPKMTDLEGFGQFLQNLKNQGMHPYLMGDFPVEQSPVSLSKPQRKPYLVR